ncbi:MAG TPA: CYTH domain-containing protein, partial [Roseiflexaceae bacterium]|nr:CYTH domain-containing protein [Roseiflexaceae bacterium]
IEAKFRVDDERLFHELLDLTSLGPFVLAPANQAEQQRNTYFDTDDRRLRAGRYGLRVREVGKRRIATLKGEARVTDGMYERDEWEVDIGADDRPEAWPPSEARERTLELLDGAALQPTLEIQTQRHHIYASRGAEQIAELSLDEGTIRAGGREQHFRELEIELLGDASRTDLDTFVDLLRDRYQLVAEDRSKLERGLALLDGDRPV